MSSLGFFHTVFDNKEASKFVIENVRKYYPDSFYMVINDGGQDYSDIIGEYNCNYLYCDTNLGYPVNPYGFKKESFLSWFKRFYVACLMTNTTHIMMMEDDVVVLDKITLNDEWETVGHNTINNVIPQQLLNIAETVSGIKPNVNFYGNGGGSIFKVETVLKNFNNIYNFFDLNFDTLQKFYPTIGWLDCGLTYFFMLCGKEYSTNPNLYTVSPWPTTVKDFDLNTVSGKYQIVDRYKAHYK